VINQVRNSFVFKTNGSMHIVLPDEGNPYEKQFYMGSVFDEFFNEKNIAPLSVKQIQSVIEYAKRSAMEVFTEKCAHIYLRENDKILNEY